MRSREAQSSKAEAPMTNDLQGSVTCWVGGLADGDEESAQRIWERYFEQLVRLAAQKLPQGVKREFDEEDVVLSAMVSFYDGVQRDRFPQLDDRNNLWALLVVITARKVSHRLRARSAQKRGGGKVRGESILGSPSHGDRPALEQVIGREPSPDFALSVAEESNRLVDRLPRQELRDVCRLKMEGQTSQEIADRLNV
ncbi:MAG: ECF-type sigma factor, partial [Planctomycetota bacterium]